MTYIPVEHDNKTLTHFTALCDAELIVYYAVLYVTCWWLVWLDRKEQSFQAAVSSWMVQLETAIGYKDGLSEALSARCALLIQVW